MKIREFICKIFGHNAIAYQGWQNLEGDNHPGAWGIDDIYCVRCGNVIQV